MGTKSLLLGPRRSPVPVWNRTHHHLASSWALVKGENMVCVIVCVNSAGLCKCGLSLIRKRVTFYIVIF